MKKQLKDYLHLYMGCQVLCIGTHFNKEKKFNVTGKLIGITHDEVIVRHNNNMVDRYNYNQVKPMLRLLKDMTQEEMKDFKYNPLAGEYSSNSFIWLLSNSFDLFELIEGRIAENLLKIKTETING